MINEIEILADRRNTIQQWIPSDDHTVYSATNSGSPNYSPTEIQYKINSCGFRSDDFSNTEDIRILFMGCSFTEGIGLHDADCWPSLILTKIKSLPQFNGKRIPKLSIALGGTGIDTESRLLHKYAKVVRPTHIFYLFFNHYRREFSINGNTKVWGPNFNGRAPESWSQVFADKEYALYQTNRGLLLIDAVAAQFNIQAHIISFENDTIDAVKSLSENYESIIAHGINLKGIDNPNFLPDQYARSLALPLKARDNMHPGAMWQYKVASAVWDKINTQFISIPHREFIQNVAVAK